MVSTASTTEREQLAALDLSWLEAQLVRRTGFDAPRAARAVRHYRCLLEIAADHPERPVAAPAGADEAWHVHLLYNERYNTDCQAVFGTILQHDPDAFGTPAFAESWEFTRAQFAERLGVALPELSGSATADPDLLAAYCWVVARPVRH